jgi:hypothetical protein
MSGFYLSVGVTAALQAESPKIAGLLGTEIYRVRLTKTGLELLHLDRKSGIIRALQSSTSPE